MKPAHLYTAIVIVVIVVAGVVFAVLVMRGSNAADGGATASQNRDNLAEELQLTASGVTRLLDGLEEQDCVEKKSCSSDARVTYAALTETGRKKLKKASSTQIAAIDALFKERFTDEELETLHELLGRLPGAGGVTGTDCTP